MWIGWSRNATPLTRQPWWGSGFLAHIASICADREIGVLVFDEDLTGSQVRNIEKIVPSQVKVLDRAAVILDIFAQRARTREAQTQVELAQLTYLLPRLTRRWTHLSRQAGGIGTRGVGETQLEIDRRMIGKKIAQLKGKLAVIERDRRLQRDRRADIPVLALVGYTNAGKSSLFQRLTRAEVLVEDRLFATLDPRARRVDLGERGHGPYWSTPSDSSASSLTSWWRRSVRPSRRRSAPISCCTWLMSRIPPGRSTSASATRRSKTSRSTLNGFSSS